MGPVGVIDVLARTVLAQPVGGDPDYIPPPPQEPRRTRYQLVLDTSYPLFIGADSNQVPALGFHGAERSFDPNAEFVLTLPVDDFTITVDLLAGRKALLTQSAGFKGDLPFDLVGASVEYDPESDEHGWYLGMGKRPTWIGYYVIKTNDNPSLVTLPLGFYFAIPFTHTGVWGGYRGAVADVTLAVLNGWDNVLDDNQFPSFLANLVIHPSDQLTLIANVIAGPEQAEEMGHWRVLGNVILQATPSDKFKAALEGNVGTEKIGGERENWGGVALTLATPPGTALPIGIAGRAEYFHDSGSRLMAGEVDAVSLALGLEVPLVGALSWVTEGRVDIIPSEGNPYGETPVPMVLTQLRFGYDSRE